jgi:hypothetical protein
MATDATGSPTSLGIPKYDTSVDAPSGLGFNAAMDAINTLIAAAGKLTVKKAGAAIGTRTSLNFIQGTNVTLGVADDAANDKVDVTITAAGGVTDPTMGGDLSGTASNAQIVANSVTATELADNSVDAAAIQSSAVTPVKMSIKHDSGLGVSILSGGVGVTFATPFSAAPVVVAGLMVGNPAANGGAGEPANYIASVSSVTSAGFTLIHNQGGTRTVPWVAVGA